MRQPTLRSLCLCFVVLLAGAVGACKAGARTHAVTQSDAAQVEYTIAPKSAQVALRAVTPEPTRAGAGAHTGAPAAPRATPVTTQDEAARARALSAAPVDNEMRIPHEISRITLTTGSAQIADFRLDAAAQIAYLTDNAYTLYVVNMVTGQIVASVATSGDRLLLDAPGKRLYVMPDAPWARAGISPTVTVFDTRSNAPIGALPGSRAGVDGMARLYVGDDVSFYSHGEEGVRLYDAATLKLLRTGPMAGNPLYDPAADGLIIQNSSAWTADAETLEPQTDLYPQITGVDLPGCTGCPAVIDAYYFAEAETIAIQTTILSPQGAGKLVPADLYRADTLARFDGGYSLYGTCSSRPQLVGPANGHALRTERYARYVTYNNLFLEDAKGKRLLMRDGLWAAFVNPSAGVAYLQTDAEHGYVLDMATLAPVGMIDSLCFFAQDQESGLLYATDAQRHDLVVLEPVGGIAKQPAPLSDTVTGKQVTAIVPSPNFAKDGTIFIVAWTLDAAGGQAILRSTDGGQTFTRLGGLPSGGDLALTLAISPNYAQDRTLFAGGARSEYMGEGVWKSSDGGNTWAPVWNGLEHLRVNRIAISPRYSNDQTLLVWAPYAQITPMETGYSLQRSTDGGQNWTVVMRSATMELLPAPSVYLPITAEANVPIRKLSWLDPIEFRIDKTSWTTATTQLGDLGAGEILRAILPAPPGAATPAVLVATDAAVYRTLDNGHTWARLAERDAGGSALMAAAVTPMLSDGAYRLLLAKADGEFLQLDPNTVAWVEMGTAGTPRTGEENSAAAAPASPTPLPAASAEPVAGDREEVAPLPTASPVIEALGEEPPAGLFRPTGIFGPAWEADGALQQALGYARSAQPHTVPAAYQYFERGVMVWRGDTQEIFAIYADGGWDLFTDTFKEGEAESDPARIAPGDLLQPVRGFGKVWRNDAVVQERLGWATGREVGLNALIQDFEHGIYLRADAVEAALIQRPAGREWQR